MAEVAYQVLVKPYEAEYRVMLVRWTNLKLNDTGAPLAIKWFSDKSVNVYGTWGSGGTLVIQGTNDIADAANCTWATLNDPQGNPLSITTNKVEQILEHTYQIRPKVTGGDATTTLTVDLLIVSPS
jgi:hypothetical protein